MNSTNDTTILAMLSRYPDISVAEQDEYISKIEHEDNIPICLAVVGRISKEELNPSARDVFEQFSMWSADRTRRARNEQISDRHRMKQNRTAIRMTQLHQQGKISDQVMLLYGISGDLPERETYEQLDETEKRTLWKERISRRLDSKWMVGDCDMWHGGGYNPVKRPTHVSDSRLRAMNLHLEKYKDDFVALEEIEPLIPDVLQIEYDCFLYPIKLSRKS